MPSQASSFSGGVIGAARISKGSAGYSHGPAMATSSTAASISMPAIAEGLRANMRSASTVGFSTLTGGAGSMAASGTPAGTARSGGVRRGMGTGWLMMS